MIELSTQGVAQVPGTNGCRLARDSTSLKRKGLAGERCAPIHRVQLFARKNATGDRGDKWDAAWTRMNVSQNCQQFFPNRVHVVSVESVVDSQHADEFIVLLEPVDNLFEWLSITGNRNHVGAVDHRDLELVGISSDQFAGLGG